MKTSNYFRALATIVVVISTTSCTSPRLKVVSDDNIYALWVNYRPLSMSAIPQTAGIVESNEEGIIDIPRTVEKVLIVDQHYLRKKEISRRPALFRFLGYWQCRSPDSISLDDCVDKWDMSRLAWFFKSPVIEELLSTEKSVFISARDLYFDSRNNPENNRETNAVVGDL